MSPCRDAGTRPHAAAGVLAVLALLAVLSVAGAIFATDPASAEPRFIDVGEEHPYYGAIQGLGEAGVIDGYPVQDGMVFRPNNAVLRAQFAKMILGVLGLPVTEEAWSDAAPPFSDLEVDHEGDLYPNDYVAVAYQRGITYGKTATTFAPYVDITRAQVISMVVRAARRFKADAVLDPPTGWKGELAAYYANPAHGANVRIAEYNGLLAGLAGLGQGWAPEARASRAEAAQIMWNLYSAEGGRFGRLLVFDDFSDPAGGWRSAVGTNSEAGYEEGRYAIRVWATNLFRLELSPGGPLTDATVAVDAHPVEGAGRSEYGLVFRVRDEDNFYQLTVQSDDTASVWRREGSAWVPMSTAVGLPAARPDGTRRLIVSMEGSVITCWVDDTKVGWFSDTTFADGRVGVFVGSIDAASAEAFFDDFVVWAIDPAGS